MRYVPYDEATEPNVVADGSPNDATVLSLSHWPGLPAPEHTWADTSAEMVLRYLDAGIDLHRGADVVTNNHFDQDGLVGVFALVDPAAAMARRELLVDVARAGDFADCIGRRAARVSMAVSALVDAAAPAPHPEQCAALYTEALGLFVELLDFPKRFRHLWKDEDEELTAAQRAVSDGLVSVVEHAELDLAVVTVDPDLVVHGGHRFGGRHADGLHPMALHGATRCVRVLVAHGDRYAYTDRYETWVQYRSRPLPRRVDLRPLAEQLGDGWTAEAPGALTPTLVAERSTLALAEVEAAITEHLRTAPPAWDPYAS